MTWLFSFLGSVVPAGWMVWVKWGAVALVATAAVGIFYSWQERGKALAVWEEKYDSLLDANTNLMQTLTDEKEQFRLTLKSLEKVQAAAEAQVRRDNAIRRNRSSEDGPLAPVLRDTLRLWNAPENSLPSGVPPD